MLYGHAFQLLSNSSKSKVLTKPSPLRSARQSPEHSPHEASKFNRSVVSTHPSRFVSPGVMAELVPNSIESISKAFAKSTVGQLYSNYDLYPVFGNQGEMIALPDPYAYHDTFSDIPEKAVVPTGYMIVPSKTEGNKGSPPPAPHEGQTSTK